MFQCVQIFLINATYIQRQLVKPMYADLLVGDVLAYTQGRNRSLLSTFCDKHQPSSDVSYLVIFLQCVLFLKFFV